MSPKPNQIPNKWLSKIAKMEGAVLASAMPSIKASMIRLQSPSLNWALGGGLVRGKVVTLYGPESAGKTLIAMLAVIAAQRENPDCFCVWYDAEFSFNKDHFAKLGGDPDRLIVYQTTAVGQKYINAKGEERLGVFQHLIQEIQPLAQEGMPLGVVVVDSVKQLRGPKEMEWTKKNDKDNGVGKVNMGNDAVAALNQGFKATIELFRGFSITCILVQQVNQEMDPSRVAQGKKWNVPSGQALKHFSDYMVLIERVERKDAKTFAAGMTNISGSDLQTGHTIRCKIEKNRTDAPARVAEMFFTYGVGVTNQGTEIAKLAEALGVMKHPLSPEGKPNIRRWTWDGGPTLDGYDNAVAEIQSNQTYQDQLMTLIGKVGSEVVDNSSLVSREPSVEFELPAMEETTNG